MPTVISPSSSYRYWQLNPVGNPTGARLEYIGDGRWMCDRCGEVVHEAPQQNFDDRAYRHTLTSGTMHS